MPAMRRSLFLFALLLTAGCSRLAQTDPATAQQIMELGDGLTLLRDEISELQEQNDSLRAMVVRNDSLVRTLANLAGVQLPSRP